MEWDLFSAAYDSETIVSRQYLANLELGEFFSLHLCCVTAKFPYFPRLEWLF